MKYYSLIAAILLAGCSAHNVEDIKLHAKEVFERNGLEIIGYEGYEYGILGSWGGCVWYTLKRKPDNGILYSACVSKWQDEYHMYNLSAKDAIAPTRIEK